MNLSDPELHKSLQSTLQQIELIQDRRDRLKVAADTAAAQAAHRVGVAHRAGNLSLFEIAAIFFEYRTRVGAGYSKHWDANVDMNSMTILAATNNGRGMPNSVDGSWSGSGRPMGDTPCPPRGIAVVYVLYDTDWSPVYVGSSGSFRQRIRAHVDSDKVFTYWRAWPCRDRTDAYRREGEMLDEVMPHLNQRRETRGRTASEEARVPTARVSDDLLMPETLREGEPR